MIMTSY